MNPEPIMDTLRIVSFSEPERLDRPFTLWPQHMVIIDWFNADQDVAKEAMNAAAANIPRVKAEVLRQGVYRRTNEHVAILKPHSRLEGLFVSVLNELHARGIRPYGGNRLPDFTPQIPLRRDHPPVNSETVFNIDHLGLVKRIPVPDFDDLVVVEYAPLKAELEPIINE